MLSGILTSLIVLLVVGAFFYFKGRHKPQSEKSSAESIASTLGNKFARDVREVAKGLRTPEAIREELIAEFKKAKKELKDQYFSYCRGIISVEEEQIALISDLEVKRENTLKKAKKLKSKYLETNETSAKSMAERFIAQSILIKEQLEKCKAIRDSATERKTTAGYTYDLAVINLSTKRAEAISRVSDIETTLQLGTLGINELLEEFNEKMLEKNIETKTQALVSGEDTETLTEQTMVSQDAITAAWDTLS